MLKYVIFITMALVSLDGTILSASESSMNAFEILWQERDPCIVKYQDQKAYLNHNFLRFHDEGISLYTLAGAVLPIYHLSCDHDGVYVSIPARQGMCDDGYWECGNCSHCNPDYKIWCEVCWR